MAGQSEPRSLVAALSADFSAARVRHLVTGAVALAVHGFVRATRDLDVVVQVPAIRLPEVFGIVRRHGFSGDDAELIRALRERFVAVLSNPTATVELIVPAIPWHATLFDRAVHRTIDGQSVPVISAEDLMLQKLLWSRPKDLVDLRALPGVLSSPLDATYMRETLRSLLPDGDARLAELEDVLRRATKR
jgi:hypothetical protein